jgi:hypothetical protein
MPKCLRDTDSDLVKPMTNSHCTANSCSCHLFRIRRVPALVEPNTRRRERCRCFLFRCLRHIPRAMRQPPWPPPMSKYSRCTNSESDKQLMRSLSTTNSYSWHRPSRQCLRHHRCRYGLFPCLLRLRRAVGVPQRRPVLPVACPRIQRRRVPKYSRGTDSGKQKK